MKDMYQKVKAYYDCGLWDETRLGNMVVRDVITEEQYIAIVGSDLEYGGGVKGDLMEGATATEDGAAGLVPPPPKGSGKRYLRSDGIWTPADGGDADTVDGAHVSRENTAGTVVARGADGSVEVGAIISDTGNDEAAALSQVIGTDGGDGRYRRYSLNRVKSGVGNANVSNMSIFVSGVSMWNAMHGGRGYVRFARIYVRNYSPHLLVFKVSNRASGYFKVSVGFTDTAGNDPALKVFQCTKFGTAKGSVYIARSQAGAWDLYIDGGNFDGVTYYGARFYDVVLTSADELVSSLPTGYITPTEVTYIP